MSTELYIEDVDRIRAIGKRFNEIGGVLNNVAKALEVAINTLNALAFVGAVGGLAVKHYLEVLKPRIEDMAKKCIELDHDLQEAMKAYEIGEEEGAKRFY